MKATGKIVGVICLMLICVRLAGAQQPAKSLRIGYVSGTSESGSQSLLAGFRQGLRDRSYFEGKNVFVEYRFAEGKVERISAHIDDLVALNVDVIVSSSFSAVVAAKKATKTIPVVMFTTQDPVATGVIESLARPGANITGLTRLTYDTNGKRLETLKDLVPSLSRVGFLMTEDRSGGVDLKDHDAPARALNVKMQALVLRGASPNLEEAFHTAGTSGVNALMVGRGPVLNNFKKQIAELAIRHRLPSMTEGSDFVDAGALASYAANDFESSRRTVVYVDKILKGAKPAELPVEKAANFEFVVNLKTAQQIGVAIPEAALKRADKVIK